MTSARHFPGSTWTDASSNDTWVGICAYGNTRWASPDSSPGAAGGPGGGVEFATAARARTAAKFSSAFKVHRATHDRGVPDGAPEPHGFHAGVVPTGVVV